MAITLEKLCAGCDVKYQMELVAGKGGMSNTVRWVHMVEDREVPDFLHGNELIFMTGIGHIRSEDRLTAFVRNLKERDASGVVINIGPYISHIPDYVLKYCDENDFPIFTLPWKVHIIDITYDFCSRIIENQKNEVSLADAFSRVITNESYISEYHDIFSKAGFSDTDSFLIAAFEFFHSGIHATERIVQNNNEKIWRILQGRGSPTVMYVDKGRLILIKQRYDRESLYLALQRLERATNAGEIAFSVGISEEMTGFLHISALFSQATAALLHANVENQHITEYRDIGIDKLICATDSITLRSYVEHTVGDIQKYDEENGTNLFGLLHCYIDNDCSVSAVSEKLGVHRNTVNYQIGRIKKVFALTLNEEEKAKMALAFRILKLNEKGKLL